MKKVIALLLCCLFVNIPLASALQAPLTTHPAPTRQISYSVNEYDLLESLSVQCDDALLQMGYSNTEIHQMRNLQSTYAEHLEVISQYDREALENLGYTETQISILQNFDGSESQIQSLAATMDFNISIDYVTWSDENNRTNARVYVDYEWAGVPLIKANDLIAISWNNWSISGKSSYITYFPTNGSGDSQIQAATYVPNNGSTSIGGGFRFPVQINSGTHWAKSGYCAFTLYHNNIRKDLSVYATYAHYTVSVTPSFTIPEFGSFQFNKSVSTPGEQWADMACSN